MMNFFNPFSADSWSDLGDRLGTLGGELRDYGASWIGLGKDENGNDMLISLKEADVGAICLGKVGTQFSLNDRSGRTNAFMRSSGIFLRESGKVGTLAQLDLTS